MSDTQQMSVDFGSARQRQDWVNRCVKFAQAVQHGVYRFEITRLRPRRSDRQNRYYWPCFVEPFAAWLTQEWGEQVKPTKAHEILKKEFLTVERVSEKTGLALSYVRSTSDLTTKEFNEYLDRVADFLVQTCDFIPSDPKDYHEREAEEGKRKAGAK